MKHSLHFTYSAHVFKEIRSLRKLAPRADSVREESLDDLFPNCKHIFLTRRNKIRQAVSWWKAINDNIWHLEKNQAQERAPVFYERHYDFDALDHLLREAILRECAIHEYFSRYGIEPLTLVYEDIVSNFTAIIRRILHYLDLSYAEPIEVEMHYVKRSSNDSEKWVQRVRKDLQCKMAGQIWSTIKLNLLPFLKGHPLLHQRKRHITKEDRKTPFDDKILKPTFPISPMRANTDCTKSVG